MLPTFSSADRETDPKRDTDQYGRCIEQYPCDKDGQDIKKLPEKDYKRILKCRINRHMKCVQPETDTITLDPVYEYYKIVKANGGIR
jgi:hypothetical protein